ncbi:phage tail protein [Paracoccus aminophilus]|uniref:Host specificity protein J n=1 Tax=Paracoccus aminophilus JCM 7686 TaxID=1367847 RepID=S5YRM8_PARAH|nr:phage tail protein [Paracoccus aminophilus]AGT07911.1 host specificity protein J [Paracoccus aminophilus JCM 7686]
MRKLLLISTALLGFAVQPDRAAAEPITLAVASVFGATAGGAGFAIIQGVVGMAVSFGLSLVVQALSGKPKSETARAELTKPTSLPAYRFVYGKTWAPGTPVAWHVRGRVLYVCYLLNSRPSAGPFTVLFDKRKVEKTGDEFDFSMAGGARATNAPFTNPGFSLPLAMYWIGKGDQTSCPARIVQECAGHFRATDAWRGRTVLWVRLDCGDDDKRSTTWPASPPEVNVDGNWSLVHDPRDGQEKFTRNQGLIVLDALRKNPMRPYRDAYLKLDTFSWAADVAGQAVPVKAGGTIPRYRCDGVLVFGEGAELEDQIQPLLNAGASRLTRIGGQLAIVPAVARPSIEVITDVTDGQPLELVRWRASDDLYTEAVGRFPAPDRAYESAETPVFVVPGAQAEDGGIAKRLVLDLDFVTDHRQAQRLAKIAAMRSRMQRQVSTELFPECFDLVAGSVCTLNLRAPYGAWNVDYEVESIAPTAGLNDDESVVIRLPVTLTETSAAVTAWNAATEEQDMLAGSFDGSGTRVAPPVTVSIETGSVAAQISGETTVPAVMAYWSASPSASATGYEWEWGTERFASPSGGGDESWRHSGWQPGGQIAKGAADDDGVFKAFLQWPQISDLLRYKIRVRAKGSYGASDWLVSAPILARGPSAVVAVPQRLTAEPDGAGAIRVSAVQANDRDARKLLIYGSNLDAPLTASLLWTDNAMAQVSVSRREAGLGNSATRYYWARARDQWGNLSDFTASASATTT